MAAGADRVRDRPPDEEAGAGRERSQPAAVPLFSPRGHTYCHGPELGWATTPCEPNTGQVPLAFAGVAKINLETGETTILEPRDRSEEQIARACAALTGG